MIPFYNKSTASSISADAVKVLLPMIRNVMPKILAHDLIGVQQMTGPAGQIFTMRTRYGFNGWEGRVALTKDHFRHFLRIYNRRKHHHPEYITSLGYSHTKLSRRNDIEVNANNAEAWCRKTLKPGSWIYSSGDFWFAYDRDYTLFVLRWS
jgi:hypothetical protein